ncbi:MAG: endo alpha-1,4 polygalactosaminidase [Thermoflexales bacterium]
MRCKFTEPVPVTCAFNRRLIRKRQSAMKRVLSFVLLVTSVVSGCVLTSTPRNISTATPSTSQSTDAPYPFVASATSETITATHTFLPVVISQNRRSLPQQARWQIQYTGEISTDLEVDVFNLDLFDTPSETIAKLHERGVFVMCYFSAGSFENWRPDAPLFPNEVLGKDMAGWPGERWLDIRRLELLAPIMQARLDLAVNKGCDGVDPDNVNAFANDTGFPLTAEDQKRYNVFLAEAAHQRGLLVGLKNDLEQVPDLVSYFDWIINEECFSYGECELLLPFIWEGKPIFVIEYELEPSAFCPQALRMNFNALHKRWELDAYRVDCRE